jgi:phasin family protein
MLPFTKEEVPPALKSHLDTQFSFMTDLSNKMFEGVQRLGQLNVQVAQTMMEETINGAHQLAQTTSPTEFLSIVTSQVQPAAEKIRAYEQHVRAISAGVHVELSKTAERHVPETTRTAAAVAEEVVRRGDEETKKVTERQKAAFDKLTKPIHEGQHQNGSIYQPPSQPLKQSMSKPS